MKKPEQRRKSASSSKEKIRKLELLLEFSKKNVLERNPDILLSILASEAKVLLDADRCSIFILDKKRKVLRSKIALGTRCITIPWDKGLAGQAVRSGKMLNIKDAYKDPQFLSGIDRKTGYVTRSILTAPMKNLKEEVLGVFQVLNKKSHKPFDKEDEDLLSILTGQGAVAIENAQLYQQIRQATQDTIFRLAAAAEFKDSDTGAHLGRMSRYSALIAKGLGYPREFRENILLASPMHDVGKMGVPDAVLMKPGKLDEKEWAEMRKHTIYGGEILKGSDNELIQMSRRIALSHHEKFDGSGYPLGLKGGEIPIEARIIALADVFDALTSKRVYKEKMSAESALTIIHAGSGRHFDPRVIRAFEKVLPKILEVLKEFEGKEREKEPEPGENDPQIETEAVSNPV